ncbi:carbohydrate binding domain-containing protein [Hymenobacter daecheongensis]|uniref:carbohydrate binding domain-containing protein n=1 Tax=Hymenobacter daecheongensis TaxID=496053 RepID=UPI0013566BC0|nr:carbohydrate binding domain-containing protein [Hymenobacter daecheongensis]
MLAANDFENLDGWLADSPALATLNQAKAHSGRYSTMVSAGHDYSLGYNNTLGRLSPEWPAKLTVGAWVLLPNDQAAAKLVVEIKGTDPAAPSLVYQAIELPKAVKLSNKWQYVEQTIAMSGTAKPDSKLLVYLWRADSKEPVYLDDLKISLAK